MIPIGALAKGMHVLTPLGDLARVDGLVIDTSRPKLIWANLTYFAPRDPLEPTVALCMKCLRAYVGPPVLFPAELQDLQARYAEPVKTNGGTHADDL